MSWHRVKLLIWKEFRQLRRDPFLLRLIVFMPILQLVLFGYVVAADIHNLRTAIVDLDHSTISRQITDGFANSSYFAISNYPKTESELRPLLDLGEVSIGVVIPEGTQHSLDRGEIAGVGIIVDGSNTQISQVSGGYASQIIAAINASRLPLNGAPGIDARVRVEFNPTMDPINTMVPALMAVILMMSLMVVMSMAVVRERESGTLEQLFVTPIRPGEYLIGKVLPYAALSSLQMVLVVTGGSLLFRVPFHGSVWVVLTGLILFMFICIGLGLLVSLVSRTRSQAQQAVMFSIIPMMVLSGFIFPIESMPREIAWMCEFIPLTHALTVLRAAFVKGSDFADLARPLTLLAVFMVVIFGSAVAATRRRLAQ